MFENHPMKNIAVATSVFGILFTTPLLFSIIWYEKSNHNRTLINQLVSSMIWYGILWMITLQIPNVIRYLTGPFPAFLCHLDIILRNSFIMQGLFYLDSMIMVRYVFIFHLKNPTALQDDFWKAFINITTLSISVLSQTANVFMPGKSPHNFYVCLGEFPLEYVGKPVKPNSPTNYLLLISVLLHTFAGIRIKCHRLQQNKIDLVQSLTAPESQTPLTGATLINFTTNAISLLLLLASAAVGVVINAMNPVTFEIFPNYIWLYVLHHYSPTVVLGSTVVIYYAKNPLLRDHIWSEFKESFRRFFRIKTIVN